MDNNENSQNEDLNIEKGITDTKSIEGPKEIIKEVEVIKEVIKEVVKEVPVYVERNSETKKELPSTSFLENKTITVKYISKESDYIKDKKHVGYGGLFIGSSIAIPVPLLDNKKMKNILTNEEKLGLEYILDRDLSIYGDFWKDAYKKGGMFPIFLSKEDTRLDLSDPMQYIAYKVMTVSPIVANGLDEIRNKATYRFVMVSEDEELIRDADALGNKVIAFENYVAHKGSKSILRYILRNLGKYTSKNQKLKFLQVETAKQIEKDPNLFVAITSDKLMPMKVLLEEAVEYGVIMKRDKMFRTLEGDPISDGDSPTLEVAATYLDGPIGQEMRLIIEAQVKKARD